MVDRDTNRVRKQLVETWQTVQSCIQTMCPASVIRPADPHGIFRRVTKNENGGVKCEVDPLIFRFPERGGNHTLGLFIGLRGWLSFGGPFGGNERLRIDSFGTVVGYFRERRDVLDHVYGVHYDYDDDQFAHPRFHAQIRPQTAFVDSINGHFGGDRRSLDGINGILRNVRTPTAEMDLFSVLIQICADHLVNQASTDEAKTAFGKMHESCAGFLGAGHAGTGAPGEAVECCRAPHWYAAQ